MQLLHFRDQCSAVLCNSLRNPALSFFLSCFLSSFFLSDLVAVTRTQLTHPSLIKTRTTFHSGALKLAICNDIGEASYDRVVVAAAMCDRIIRLSNSQKGYVDMKKIIDRYVTDEFLPLVLVRTD